MFDRLRWLVFALVIASVGPSIAVRGQSSLPAGVTLRDIDGGPSYYADHGFTYAAQAGWDRPDFFPIGLWQAPMHTQADADRWRDLNLNAFVTVTANSTSFTVTRQRLFWHHPVR